MAWRIVILTIAAGIAAACVMAWWRRPARRIWTLPPVSWALHCAAFYVVVLWGDASPMRLNQWSNALRVHEAVLVLAGVVLFLWPARERR